MRAAVGRDAVREWPTLAWYDHASLPEPDAMQSAAPDYDQLGRLLAVSELSPSAAEAHGLYCGLLAAATPHNDPEPRWLAELLPSAVPAEAGASPGLGHGQPHQHQTAVDECRLLLHELAAHTRAQIDGPAFGIELFLPADDRPLRERAVGVHEWTRGFLFGLGLAGVDAARLAPQTREAFDDLLEVTRMDLNDLDDDEANEQALSDVTEFIRVAAMLLYEDDCPLENGFTQQGSPDNGPSEYLQ
jgi:uncharacterized protein YgfB (UPF0149 family)